MSPRSVLIIDDDALLAKAVGDALRVTGHEVVLAPSVAAAREAISQARFDVVVLDQQLPDGEGASLCPELLAANEQAKVLFVTAFPSYEHAVRALRAGAWDYLSKPFELSELLRSVERAVGTSRLERSERLSSLQRAPPPESTTLHREAGLREVAELVRAAAPSSAPVLLTGETGTGKNRVARALHEASARRAGPFVTLNCAALPEHLIEAELFGWERGAFTGAVAAREGLLEFAEGGTLFLDEIGEMPTPLQAKLLTVLEDREVRRLGARASRPTDVRVVAATNADLEDRVADGRFRADLFYRLNVVRIALPPLRERTLDLPELCRELLASLSPGTPPPPLAPGELERLASYGWPGNVRELRNVLERALILHRDLLRPSELLAPSPHAATARAHPPSAVLDLTLEQMERLMMERALVAHAGNLTAAARALGVSLSTLKRRVKTLGLERARVRGPVKLTGSG